jgi:hypothetical protein
MLQSQSRARVHGTIDVFNILYRFDRIWLRSAYDDDDDDDVAWPLRVRCGCDVESTITW